MRKPADSLDQAAGNADVGGDRRRSEAVVEEPSGDNQIEFVAPGAGGREKGGAPDGRGRRRRAGRL